MNVLFDFLALQGALSDWPDVSLPPKGADGVYERIRQILAPPAERRLCEVPQIWDLIPLLGQVMRRETARTRVESLLRVPSGPGWPDRKTWNRFGMRAQSAEPSRYLLQAKPWEPDWLERADEPVFQDALAERPVRQDWRRPMDPFLAEASGLSDYVSAGQREAVRSAFLVPPGGTLIVALPTGSGKSLAAQAPVLVRGLEGGLTICVVPTTALVLDQARQMTKLLKSRRQNVTIPALAWHAGLSSEARRDIKQAIRQGRQGILYCSPEAMTGALLPAFYDAARAGTISYLVIDEAHLLSEWGDGFRPALQMLAGVRRGLLDSCPSERRLRTILMSATLTPDTLGTFDALFGPTARVQMAASIHLRPEPQYWIHHEDDNSRKTTKVLEAIRYAPRPFIFYVTKRDDARRWTGILRAEGYQRLDCFHGETRDADRQRIIDAWAANELDGIVATSAFGVGIDKQDVRTVIHATVPETLDRFYQEVGRGGRDGCASGSLLVYSHVDREIADSLSAPALISDELGFERWEAMFDAATALNPLGTLLQLDLDVVPRRLRRQSDYNAAWNMRTLIMMARAGLLQLESRPPEEIEQSEGETDASFEVRNEEYWAKYFRQTVVRMLHGSHRNEAEFNRAMSKERARATEAAADNRDLLDRLLKGDEEMAELLDDLYRNYAPGRSVVVSRACGGCPAHRKSRSADLVYSEPLACGIEVVISTDLSRLRSDFPHLNLNAPVILSLPETFDQALAFGVLKDLVEGFAVREVAVPAALRPLRDDLARLHKRAPDGLVLVQTLEEDLASPSLYRVPRATLLVEPVLPKALLLLDRPAHIILAPADTPDPAHPHRKLADTGENLLTYEQFRAGARI